MSAVPTNDPRDMTPPDRRDQVAADALAHFMANKDRYALFVLYTDQRRPTPGWRGLTDPEVYVLLERGLAKAGPVLPNGQRRIELTTRGRELRDKLSRRLR